jgi:hypothetical protein
MTQPRTRRDDDRGGHGRGVDAVQIVDGTLVNVMAGYDNEWGCTHQMIREARGTTLAVSGDSNKPVVPSSHRGGNLVGSSVWNWPPRRWLPARTIRVVDGRAAG